MCSFPHILNINNSLGVSSTSISSIHQIYDVDLHNYHMTGFISSIESYSSFHLPSLTCSSSVLCPLNSLSLLPRNPQKCRYHGRRVIFLPANLLWLPGGLGGSTFLHNCYFKAFREQFQGHFHLGGQNRSLEQQRIAGVS